MKSTHGITRIVIHALSLAVFAGVPQMALSGQPQTQSGPVEVKDVENPAKSAFQAECVAQKDTNVAGLNVECTLTTVPAGKRAVIEYASADCFTTQLGNTMTKARIVPINAGQSFETYLEVKPALTPIEFIVSQPVRAYAEAGASILFVAHRNSHTTFLHCNPTIAGYFVDIP